MERLMIDEVIGHCERTVERFERQTSRVILENMPLREPFMKEYWEHRQVAEWLKELQVLKDLQEQGLLISLPCKVGDKAWVIDDCYERDFVCQKVYEAEWVRVTMVQTKANGSFDLRGEVKYQIHDYFYDDGRTMPHGMYVGQVNTKVGERVFLTRSEAEEALAKMGGTNESKN